MIRSLLSGMSVQSLPSCCATIAYNTRCENAVLTSLASSVVEPESEPQEPKLFALAEPDRNAVRFRNRIWIRIQHKM
jgi:hypothetical protein